MASESVCVCVCSDRSSFTFELPTYVYRKRERECVCVCSDSSSFTFELPV